MSFDDRLRQQFLRAGQQMPHASVDWATTIGRGRRQRTWRIVAVAAAAVFLVAGGALSARGLLDSDPAPLPGPAGTPDHEPTPDQSPTGDVSEGVDPSIAGPAVLHWAEALASGDAQGAWDMLSPASQEYYGDVKSFEKNFMSELVEAFGSWANAPAPSTDVRVLISGGDGATGVVVLYGEVAKEGPPRYDADAVAFRISGDTALMEPYSSKIEIQPIEPTEGQEYDQASLPAEFEAEVPSDLLQVNFYVEGVEHDGRQAKVEKKEQQGSQPPNSIASFPVPEGLSTGVHFLTIAAVDLSGEVAVRVVPFTLLP